jgi:hypothetical protein
MLPISLKFKEKKYGKPEYIQQSPVQFEREKKSSKKCSKPEWEWE